MYNKCENCGSAVVFDPKVGQLRCTKCGSFMNIEYDSKYKIHDLDMDAIEVENNSPTVHFKCSNCGANTDEKLNNISDKCRYCGASLVADFSENPELAPDAVVPFAFNLEDAGVIFKSELKGKAFLPNKLKKSPIINSIESVYIPAYLFSSNTMTDYSGSVYERYEDSDGDTHYRHWNISGCMNLKIDNIPVEASSKIDGKTLNKLLPYQLNQRMVAFREEFIMGYSVEYYNILLNEAKSCAKNYFYDIIRSRIISSYKCDGVDYLDMSTKYGKSSYSKILLPTYRIRYKHKDQIYESYMNGQNGKVFGKFPRSAVKIASLVGGILGAILLIILIIVLNS